MDREQDQTRAMGFAAPLLAGVHEVLHSAMDLYQGDGYSDQVRAEHTDRAAANCVYAHAEKAMVRQFDSTPGINFINVRSLHVLNYLDLVVLRFKKVSASGKHRNYQTPQQQEYDDQKTIPGLPDEAVRLTAGYQLDPAGFIERVMIARPIGREIFWTAQIVMAEDVASWVDITPARFVGTSRSDFDADRARRGRRPQ